MFACIYLFMERQPTHPGKAFRDSVLNPLNITLSQAAREMMVTRKHLSKIVNCHKELTPEMAIRFAAVTNTSPESWLLMQARLNLWNVKDLDTHQIKPFDGAENIK